MLASASFWISLRTSLARDDAGVSSSSTLYRRSVKIFRTAGVGPVDLGEADRSELTIPKFFQECCASNFSGNCIIFGKAVDRLGTIGENCHSAIRIDGINHGKNKLGAIPDDVLSFIHYDVTQFKLFLYIRIALILLQGLTNVVVIAPRQSGIFREPGMKGPSYRVDRGWRSLQMTLGQGQPGNLPGDCEFREQRCG